ncbi:Gfo/Idh/MocA family oxidoreductase [Pseudoalteromonas agarivorans]|uniref:Gfo/Idh/MocA family protein n=1 Tax=Pseudoalteromonas agarivorans TaxID=176102 RepID=UPI0021188C17|nr:Gfo/Idh/MocA family oxidoreductase [Pseudoalteromonas agarivorans]MCQ8818866.1 Gfo/Idh/MocA family oxidoreductase [Pseudoalteromonas agarivorans]
MNKNKTVRWGIAGLGSIAQRFAFDLKNNVNNAELYAVSSRSQERADKFANEFACQTAYGDYKSLAENPHVDVVYVATIHPCHKELVALFLAHNKHVFVEKPAFTNVKDWDEMLNLAKSKNLLLIEAMKSVTFPAYRELLKFIKSHNLAITCIEASFGTKNEFNNTNRLFDPKQCGGATLDVGVYPLWLYVDICRQLNIPLQKPLVNITRDNPISAVDEMVYFVFNTKVQGNLSASITRNLPSKAVLSGPNVEIIIHEKWWNPQIIEITHYGAKQKIEIDSTGESFEFEIEHISTLILTNKLESDVIPHANSRAVIEIMEQALIANGYQHLVTAQNV